MKFAAVSVTVHPQSKWKPAITQVMVCGVLAWLNLSALAADPSPASSGEPISTSIQSFLTNAGSWGETVQVRLRGVVTHSISDKTFFIQEDGAGLYVFHRPEKSFVPGELVEVTASPSLGGVVPTLQRCTVKAMGTAPLPAPIVLSAAQALESTNAMKLGRMVGHLQKHRLAGGRTLVLQPMEGQGQPVFEVNAEAVGDLEPVEQLPAGCLLQATGVVAPKRGPDQKIAGIRLLIRSPADLVVIKGPPFWTSARLAKAAAATAIALTAAGAWIVLLRREVRRQTASISQKLEKEAALRASEDRFLKVFRTTPDVLVIVRAADEKILDVNPAFERITGYARAEAVGHTTRELGLYADLKVRAEILQQFKEGNPVTNIFIEARRKDGGPIWLHASMERIEWNGEKCWLSVSRDITEQKEAEDQQRQLESMLHQSQKMEALGTMAGGIAHDFNNVLAAILANAELAEMCEKALANDVKGNLEAIRSAALRGKNLVSQIQAFGRKRRQPKQSIQLDSTVDEAARLLRAIAPGSIRIETRIHPNCPPAAGADADAILQVIVNLGTNGCHAMERQPGTLTIELEPVTLDAGAPRKHPNLAPGRYLRLTVTDQGEGMDAQTIGRIFDPFFTTKAPGKGTGLGLAITHSVVADHQGVILVESAPGAGSKFMVYLQAASPSMTEKVFQTQPSAPRGSGESILLVDDEPALIEATQRILERIGYSVTALTNPVQAMKLMGSAPGRFQLLLTDLNMPEMSGLELIRRLRETRATFPIILLSGYITEEHRAQALTDPALHLLNKPVTMGELGKAIATALS